jgi:prenyltransferase beta subunit
MLPEALSVLSSAILRCQAEGGGFGGLDGRPDLYFSFFAWLSLTSLGAEYDQAALVAWTGGELKNSRGVDRVCAELILLQAGARSRFAATLFLLGSFIRLGAVDSYKLFLNAFLMEALLPQWFCGALVKRAADVTLKQRAYTDFNSLSTPRAAMCSILAHRIGDPEMQERMAELQRQRHSASGGYGSTSGVSADLLSTAVVLFAAKISGQPLDVHEHDRAFIEMCWQEDGLFSAAPDQSDGDLEHTFYALLALGCR